MKVEHIDLHGHNLKEAMEKVSKNIDWCIHNGIPVLVINHGKGHHSQSGFPVLKSEIRKMLKESTALREAGYKVLYGESDFPITLTFNEGQTLIVARGYEKEYIGGQNQQTKNKRIYSKEGKQERKAYKQNKSPKRYR